MKAITSIAIVVGAYFLMEPYTNKWVMQQEATAGGYAILAKEYPSLAPDAQQNIRVRISKGFLTRNDVSDMISEIVKGRPGGVQVYPAPDFGDAPEDASAHLWKSLRGERASYKSKALLVAQLNGGIKI